MADKLSNAKILEALDNQFSKSQRGNPNKKDKVGLVQQFKDMYAILKERNNNEEPDLDEAVSLFVRDYEPEPAGDSLASGYPDQILGQEEAYDNGDGKSLADANTEEQKAPEGSLAGEYSVAEEEPRGRENLEYDAAPEERGIMIKRAEDGKDPGGDNEVGGRVRAIQESFIAKGYDLKGGASGFYNAETEEVVKLLQKLFGQEDTGIVDAELYERLTK